MDLPVASGVTPLDPSGHCRTLGPTTTAQGLDGDHAPQTILTRKFFLHTQGTAIFGLLTNYYKTGFNKVGLVRDDTCVIALM